MHIVVSWDIHADGDPWDHQNNRLKEVISNFRHAKPLSTFYMVEINSTSDRDYIVDRLTEIANNSRVPIRIIVSPAMKSGSYNGWLVDDMWSKVNDISGY